MGAFAEHPRYQGAGSSLVNPTRLDTALAAMRERLGTEGELLFAGGYDPVTGATTPVLLAEVRSAAATADAVVASDDVVSLVARPAGPLATDDEFAALLGRPVPRRRPLLPLHEDSTIDDLGLVTLGKPLRAALLKAAGRAVTVGDDPATDAMVRAVTGQMPLRSVVSFTGGRISFAALDRVIAVLNLGVRRTTRQ